MFQVRIWGHCIRLLKVNRCGTQAAALAYHTVFGLVPMAIVALMVFQLLPVSDEMGQKARHFLYEQMNLYRIEYPTQNPDLTNQEEVATISVAEKLDAMVNEYISKTNTGAITVVGVAFVIWASIALLTTIERAFNNIYHVTSGRSFLNRVFNYWALLTLGPILLGLAIYISSKHLISIGILERLFAVIAPFFISWLAFFLLYNFLPNTPVHSGAALWGAFVAAVIWTAIKWAFGWYVGNFVPQFAIYGVLGLIPITVLWIFITWMIVLFGLQLTYAAQNIKRLDQAELDKARKQEKCFLANDQTVVRVMEYVLNAFEHKDQKPVSVEAVAYRLQISTDFTEKILNRMVESGLLCHTSEPTVGYVPSTDGTHITLDEISRAISEVSFAQPSAADGTHIQAVFDEVNRQLSRHTLKQVMNKDEDFEVQSQAVQESSDSDDEEQTA